jgi:hypothetical protein
LDRTRMPRRVLELEEEKKKEKNIIFQHPVALIF